MKSYSYNAFMRKWNLGIRDPYSIILAADNRISPIDFTNNQIWMLDLGKIEPLSIQLFTTFGFRAQNLSIFPQFTENHNSVLNPIDFIKQPQIEFFAPNFVSLHFEPFLGISVNMDVHIADSQTITGRFLIRNSGGKKRNINFDLAALLNPDPDGITIQQIKKEISSVLYGKTGNLHPVLFITGGAKGTVNPYPALRHQINLNPGEFREFSWAMASLKDQNESFQHARKNTARNWPALTRKIKMLAGNKINIKTGEKNWDASFAFSQNIARSLVISQTEHIKHESFVQSLNPNHGFALTEDGRDYGHLWNGQTVYDVYQLSEILLLGEVKLIKGFLQNFLDIQEKDGYIDGKPGPAGQRQNQLAAPLLSQIAIKIFEVEQDIEFLKQIYPKLKSFFICWFSADNLTQESNIPVWNNIIQSNFDSNPKFTHVEIDGQGADIKYALSPDLLSHLFNESSSLQKIAKLLNINDVIVDEYQSEIEKLLSKSWNQRTGEYRYLDIASKKAQVGKNIFSSSQNGVFDINFSDASAKRLMLQVNTEQIRSSNLKIKIHAKDNQNKLHVIYISYRDLRWILNRGTFTFPKLLTEISSIKISSLPENGSLTIRQVEYNKIDQNSLLPISTGLLTKSQINKMVSKHLSNESNLLKKNGITAIEKPLNSYDANLKSIWLFQNQQIIKGLYDNGYKKEAIKIYSSLINNIAGNLNKNKSFSQFYHSELDSSSGETNIISGLPSISLFLHLLGIQIINQWKIKVHAFNPFPWPVEISYKGINITCQNDHLKIRFPNRKEEIIFDPSPCIIETSP